MNRYGIVVTFDEAYEFIKLYDILRDMDFELTPLQESVFDKIQQGRTMLRSDWQTVTHTTAYTLTIHYNEYIRKGLMNTLLDDLHDIINEDDMTCSHDLIDAMFHLLDIHQLNQLQDIITNQFPNDN